MLKVCFQSNAVVLFCIGEKYRNMYKGKEKILGP